ncbi:MAG TPA: recombination-associated protein RdgC [Gaiellaceae bacterium]|nr:recombination-associated protein RdgC [Gaiellaceae bacterium]
MFFRNLTLYRFADGAVPASAVLLEEALMKLPLEDISGVEVAKRGFVSPWGRNDERMLMSDVDAHLFALGGYEKVMPAAAIAEEVRRRCDDFEKRTGSEPNFKERQQLRDEVRASMLVRAFLKPVRTLAYIDLRRGWLVIDTASRPAAETLVSHLRSALGTFQCTPAVAPESPRRLMTAWLITGTIPLAGRSADQTVPDGIAFGEDCDLLDPADKSRKWSGRRCDPEVDAQEHLNAGMQVERLELYWAPEGKDPLDGHLTFVLGADLVLRRLHFTDKAIEQITEADREAATEAGASAAVDFCLMNREVALLLAKLETVFQIERSPPLKLDAQEAPPAMKAAIADEKFETPGEAADELLAQAIARTREDGKVSVSYIQRQFKIGYNRAARLVEAMEEQGVVSAPNASGFRTVLDGGVA